MIRIAVSGNNEIAASIAAFAALQGHEVRSLRSSYKVDGEDLPCVMPDGSRFAARMAVVTTDPERGLDGADVVFVCVGHAEIERALIDISPYVPKRALVGGVPGSGGFGILARKHLARHVVFGLQRIPFVIRDYAPERGVFIGGVRRQTFVGTMPAAQALPVANLLRAALGVPAVPVSHYVNIELSPSNSIVNPARLHALFAGCQDEDYPGAATEFFADWDLHSSIALLSLDAELRATCARMPRDTSFVAPILFQYDANNAETLTQRIRALTALHGRRIPLDHTGERPMLDTSSRYFTEDVDIGLTTLKRIFSLAGVATPFTDSILAWRRSTVEAGLCEAWAHRSDPACRFGSLNDLAQWLD